VRGFGKLHPGSRGVCIRLTTEAESLEGHRQAIARAGAPGRGAPSRSGQRLSPGASEEATEWSYKEATFDNTNDEPAALATLERLCSR